jgi:hypothetical protein
MCVDSYPGRIGTPNRMAWIGYLVIHSFMALRTSKLASFSSQQLCDHRGGCWYLIEPWLIRKKSKLPSTPQDWPRASIVEKLTTIRVEFLGHPFLPEQVYAMRIGATSWHARTYSAWIQLLLLGASSSLACTCWKLEQTTADNWRGNM